MSALLAWRLLSCNTLVACTHTLRLCSWNSKHTPNVALHCPAADSVGNERNTVVFKLDVACRRIGGEKDANGYIHGGELKDEKGPHHARFLKVCWNAMGEKLPVRQPSAPAAPAGFVAYKLVCDRRHIRACPSTVWPGPTQDLCSASIGGT